MSPKKKSPTKKNVEQLTTIQHKFKSINHFHEKLILMKFIAMRHKRRKKEEKVKQFSFVSFTSHLNRPQYNVNYLLCLSCL